MPVFADGAMTGAANSSHSTATTEARRDSGIRASRSGEVALELLDAAGLRGLDAAAWDRLAVNALDENPFYARQYVLAGLETIDCGAGLRALALRLATDERLCGLFLFQEQRFPLPVAAAAANLYQFSGTPLVDREHAEAVIAAWLEALAAGVVRRHWSLPNVALDSAFMRIAEALATRRGYRMLPACSYQRAQLRRLPGGFEEHLGTAIPRGRAKDLRRRLRRLEECGEVRLEQTDDPDLVARRVEDFLQLEHAGWKGAAGTSLLADPVHAEFARRAFGGHGEMSGLASADSLLLDGRPIAVNINIRTGGTVFTPKCAFDESYRRYSPGLLLEYLVIKAFYADDSCAEMDAATTVDGHVLQGLWNAEKPMATVIVGPCGWQTAALARVHEQRAALKDRAKEALASPPLTPVTRLMRAWRRWWQARSTEAMVTLMCTTHTFEGLVKVGL